MLSKKNEQLVNDYEKWWNHELDRPIIQVTLSTHKECEYSRGDLLEMVYDQIVSPLDVVKAYEKTYAAQIYLGDAFPQFYMRSTGILGAYLGQGLKIDNKHGTIWFQETGQELEDIHLKLDKNFWLYQRSIDILKEFSRLKLELEQLLSEARYRTCFSCLKQSEPEYMRTIQNTRYEQLEEIITDIPEIYEQIQEFQKEDALLRNISLTLYEDSMLSLSSLYNVSKQIERALDKRVWLPSGGYLVIEPTEALTVIDVNTGKDVNKRKKQEHFLKVNKEAARMAAKQLRLRNLSGIIIIDFIDMKQEEDRKELLSYLKKEVQLDPVPVQVVDMTKLELVELTRKKVSKNLKEQLT